MEYVAAKVSKDEQVLMEYIDKVKGILLTLLIFILSLLCQSISYV